MSQHIEQALPAARTRSPLFGFWRVAKRRAPRLDLETLPEHLKRDLGFAGGRVSPPRDIFRD